MTGNSNIAGALPQRVGSHPLATAVNEHGLWGRARQYSYRQLDEASDILARGLRVLGIGPGARVALLQPPGADFFAWTFALFKLGAVPAFIDPGMGVGGLGKCLGEAAPEAFVGVGRAQWARLVLGWARSTNRISINTGGLCCPGIRQREIEVRGAQGEPVLEEKSAADQAAILFTSGSTGPAKGAIYTHGMFQEQVRVLRELFAIEEGEVDLCTFPLFALFAPAMGMTSVVPRMNPTRPAKADPRKLIHDIESFGVTNIFGSPALLDTLSRFGQQAGVKLSSLRRVISAGAPVSAKIIERMATLLPRGVQVFTPYGATEALPVAVIGSDEVLGETREQTDRGAGVCVGRPVSRVEVRIIPISDGPLKAMPPALPTGEIGEITVRGPVVSPSYWRRPDADALHKIVDGNDVWHRMGDVGYLDPVGRLWFCGRKSQRVMTAGTTLFTIPCEAIFNTHPAVKRSALVDVHGCAVLCVEPEAHASAPQLVAELRHYRERFAPAWHISEILIYPGAFPVDIRHNAKIHREKLAAWAARRPT